MKKFNKYDIVSYYDQTEIHYRMAWDLRKSLAMHYGYYGKNTRTFRDSLANMNEEMARFASITKEDEVLDAGCGVGGSAIFLARTIGCKVTGITLSERQAKYANAFAYDYGVDHLAHFVVGDYTKTAFPDKHFTLVWALESSIHASDKKAFIDEMARVLQPGGRLIIGDYFKKDRSFTAQEEKVLMKWMHAIAASHMPTKKSFSDILESSGFIDTQFEDITQHIRHSSWRQFYGSFVLRMFSWLSSIFLPNNSFANKHHEALYYQYIAMRKGLWSYAFLLSELKE